MNFSLIRNALITAACALGIASADVTCGKIEWVYNNVKGNGSFAFKLLTSSGKDASGNPIPASNAYTIGYSQSTSNMAMSQLLTAKTASYNVCVDFPTGNPGSVNSINVMQP